MNEERFDQLMRAATPDYNRPPAVAPLDEMWAAIEQARRNEARVAEDSQHGRPFLIEPRKRPLWARPWLRMVAVLVVGLALGRFSASISGTANSAIPPAGSTQPFVAVAGDAQGQYPSVTVSYLGETVALLVALPGELRNQRTDPTFVTRADDLLLQTRLLLDSPVATEPTLRALFEDLEVVLAQVVRLQADRDPTRIELLNQALEQGEVIPRLRNAVVHHIAD
jgi:hypothetical protein